MTDFDDPSADRHDFGGATLCQNVSIVGKGLPCHLGSEVKKQGFWDSVCSIASERIDGSGCAIHHSKGLEKLLDEFVGQNCDLSGSGSKGQKMMKFLNLALWCCYSNKNFERVIQLSR